MKLKAGAIYYVILLSLLVTIITLFIILLNYYSSIIISDSKDLDSVISDIYSSFELTVTDDIKTGEFQLDLYKNEKSIVDVKIEQWGAFYIITSKSNSNKFPISKSAIVGTKKDDKDELCLFLKNNNKQLYVSGETKIIGDILVPDNGIRTKTLEGISFHGDFLHKGKSDTSDFVMPEIDLDFLENPYNIDEQIIFLNNDTVYNPFSNEIIDYDPQNLNYYSCLRGKIRLFSDQAVVIPKSCDLKDVIIIAPVIIFDSGFTGTVQAFATDSIIVNSNVTLSYPSFLMVKSRSGNHCKITINEDSEVHGGICLYDDKIISKNSPSCIHILERTKISGIIYSNKTIELKGSVKGRVFTDKFVHITASSAYENILINAEISIEDYNKHFIEPIVLKKENIEILKWLN